MSHPDEDATPAQGPLAGVAWHDAVLAGIPAVFLAALTVGLFANVAPGASLGVGAAASLAVTGYGMFWAPHQSPPDKT